jgi:uncharacterized protein YcnI
VSWSERCQNVLAHLPGRSLVAGGGLALVGMIVLGPAAVADVNISPAQADQGGEAAITFQIRNDRPGVFTTKVKVEFPQATPVGEIYPMSIPNWAPVATSRELDTPVDGVHNSGLTTVTSAITWSRSPDAPKAPAVEKLSVELGPLPKSNDFVMTVTQTYSDGKTKSWSGPTPASSGVAAGTGTVLHLVPPAAAAAPAADPAVTDQAITTTVPGQGRTVAQLGLIAAGIVGGILISALAVVTIGSKARGQQSADAPAEEKADVDA